MMWCYGMWLCLADDVMLWDVTLPDDVMLWDVKLPDDVMLQDVTVPDFVIMWCYCVIVRVGTEKNGK